MRVSCGTQNTFSETWELKGLTFIYRGTFIYSRELVLQKHENGVVLSGSFVLGLLAIHRDLFKVTFS